MHHGFFALIHLGRVKPVGLRRPARMTLSSRRRNFDNARICILSASFASSPQMASARGNATFAHRFAVRDGGPLFAPVMRQLFTRFASEALKPTETVNVAKCNGHVLLAADDLVWLMNVG